jgi:hypothetical protein
VSAAPVNHADEIACQIEPFVREPGAGMIVLPRGLMINNREKIAALAAQYRLPAIYANDSFAESGGLVSYGPDSVDLCIELGNATQRLGRDGRGGRLLHLVDPPTDAWDVTAWRSNLNVLDTCTFINESSNLL